MDLASDPRVRAVAALYPEASLRFTRTCCVVLSCGALIAPVSAWAQVKLEVAPFFTSYYATAFTSRNTPDSTERQEAGPGLGLNVTYRFSNIIGIQASAAYVWSGVIPRQPSTAAGTFSTLQALPGRLTFGSVRATAQPRRSNYYLAAGMGVVRRSGEAWNVPSLTRLTDPTATLGFGIRARVTPEWAFNIGVDTHLYFSDMDGPNLNYYQRRLQRDILVTIGVPFALIER